MFLKSQRETPSLLRLSRTSLEIETIDSLIEILTRMQASTWIHPILSNCQLSNQYSILYCSQLWLCLLFIHGEMLIFSKMAKYRDLILLYKMVHKLIKTCNYSLMYLLKICNNRMSLFNFKKDFIPCLMALMWVSFSSQYSSFWIKKLRSSLYLKHSFCKMSFN